MLDVLTREEAQENDAYTIKNFYPSIELMEEAGHNCFLEIIKHIKKNDEILIVCGSGGNGGDGLVIARYLLSSGYNIKVFLISKKFKEETLTNFNLYKGEIVSDLDKYLKENRPSIIVDALLGIGVKTNLKDSYINVINKLNKVDAYKVSVDINSGLDSTNGLSLGAIFISDLTITIQNYKSGLFLNEGKGSHKKLKVVDAKIKPAKPNYFLKILEKKDIKKLFPDRKENSNKGDYGRVALIGGSKLTPGAIELSYNALSSLRMGVGYASLCIPESLYSSYALINPENIYFLFDDENGSIKFNKEKLDKLMHYNAILVGPGIGVSEDVYKIVSYLMKNFKGNLLLDADALNAIARYGVNILLESVTNSIVLTPHIKEFSRLSGLEIKDILSNPVENCSVFAKKYHVIVNLKSNVSVISDGEISYLNITGNSGLAKGGSGDVLSGITLGLLNKNNDILLRVASASYILGLSADLAIKEINTYSLLSRDVSAKIPFVINEIIK